MSTIVIAEAGVNHNGDLQKAFQLIDAASEAGADIVKFQIFKAENLATTSAEKANYQKITTNASESQFSMLKKLELDNESYFKLQEYCHQKEIDFLLTAFDFDSLKFLLDELRLKMLKISSGDITNAPLVLSHAVSGRDIILSTGMTNLNEVETALSVISYGYLNQNIDSKPSIEDFKKAYNSSEGKDFLKEKVILLHCTTEYPAPLKDINLDAMNTLKDHFKLKVGYSDHSEGLLVPIAAAALGAKVIEKHITLNKNDIGPDHKASLEPDQFKRMVLSIRDVEILKGDGIKKPRESELDNITIARKSIFAKKIIKSGEIFTEDNIALKRPCEGLNPIMYWEILGKEATRDYEADEVIK